VTGYGTLISSLRKQLNFKITSLIVDLISKKKILWKMSTLLLIIHELYMQKQSLPNQVYILIKGMHQMKFHLIKCIWSSMKKSYVFLLQKLRYKIKES